LTRKERKNKKRIQGIIISPFFAPPNPMPEMKSMRRYIQEERIHTHMRESEREGDDLMNNKNSYIDPYIHILVFQELSCEGKHRPIRKK